MRSAPSPAFRLATKPDQAATPSKACVPSRSAVYIGYGEDTAVLLPLHVDQPIAIGHRESLQECGVDDAEDGGVGADAEAERQYGREREGWLLPQRADGIAKVLPEISKQVSGRSPRRDGFGCVRLSQRLEVSCEQIPLPEPGKRQPRRFVLRRPARHQFPPAILEMLRQLLDDLVLTGPTTGAVTPGASECVASNQACSPRVSAGGSVSVISRYYTLRRGGGRFGWIGGEGGPLKRSGWRGRGRAFSISPRADRVSLSPPPVARDAARAGRLGATPEGRRAARSRLPPAGCAGFHGRTR